MGSRRCLVLQHAHQFMWSSLKCNIHLFYTRLSQKTKAPGTLFVGSHITTKFLKMFSDTLVCSSKVQSTKEWFSRQLCFVWTTALPPPAASCWRWSGNNFASILRPDLRLWTWIYYWVWNICRVEFGAFDKPRMMTPIFEVNSAS